MTHAPLIHLRGPIILGREEELSEAWVYGGRIFHVRPDVPAGIDVQEISGFVVPGLADLHCHIGIGDEGEPLTVTQARQQALTDRDSGVLLIRDAGSMVDTRPLQDHSPGSLGHGVPTLIRCGRHISRTRRYLPGYACEVEPEQLAQTVSEQARASDGWVKMVGDWIDRHRGDLSPTFSAEDFRRAADAAHHNTARITAHTFCEETLPLLLDAGFDCLEHATGLTDDTIARTAEARIPVVTTLVNVGHFEDYARQGEKKFPAYSAHMRKLREKRFARTRDAFDAGIPLLVGTDAGGVLGHGIIHDELDEIARAGLKALDILDAAIFTARRFLGAPALEHGSSADLLICDADPRADHRALRHRRAVMLRGEILA